MQSRTDEVKKQIEKLREEIEEIKLRDDYLGDEGQKVYIE